MSHKNRGGVVANSWERRDGESARSWLARLKKVNGPGLSLLDAARLAESIRLATAMVSLERRRRRQAEALLKKITAAASAAKPAKAVPGMSALDRGKEAVRQMSAAERKQFFVWLMNGMSD